LLGSITRSFIFIEIIRIKVKEHIYKELSNESGLSKIAEEKEIV
jgi:hypothetical protein